MKIVVDAMGGDYAPAAIIEGVVDAVNDLNVHVAVVGVESVTSPMLIAKALAIKIIKSVGIAPIVKVLTFPTLRILSPS